MSLAGFLGNVSLVLEGREWLPRPGSLITEEEVVPEDQSDVFSG